MNGTGVQQDIGWLAAGQLGTGLSLADLWAQAHGRCRAAAFSPVTYQLELWFSAWRW